MRFFTIVAGLTWLGLRLSAGQLYMINEGDANFTGLPPSGVTYSGPPLTPNQSLTGQSAPGNRGYTETFAAYLSYPHLGLNISTSDFCLDTSCGVESQRNNLAAISLDTLGITGTSSGSVVLQFILEGTLSFTNTGGTSTFDASSVESLINGGNAVYASVSDAGDMQFGGTLSPDPTLANTWDYYSSRQLTLQFSGGSTGLTIELFGGANCAAGNNQTCSSSLSFLNSALVGGAVVYDANGNIVPGATVTGSSGYDYTQPITADAVPEPASWILTIVGLLAGAFAIRPRSAESVHPLSRFRVRFSDGGAQGERN